MSGDRLTESFGAVPRRLLRDLALGEVNFNGFAILCYLTLAENPHTGEWIGTTARMAEELAWEFTLRHLSREVKRLADDGWIESGVKPGGRKNYRLSLTEKSRTSTAPRPHLDISTGSPVEVTSTGSRSEAPANPLHDEANASLGPRPGRGPKTETAAERKDQVLDLDQTPESGERPAAAGSPPSESEIREAVASLRGADRQSLNVVEPLANGVTRETFLELVERARDKQNPVGWLIARLRDVNREVRLDGQTAAAAQAPTPIERLPLEQALEANVRQLADNGHAWEAIAEHVSGSFGPEHVDAARVIYDRVQEAA